MNNSVILVKVRLRLNKLSSNDFDNIQSWQIIEAFNKGSVDWCRRNLHGTNTKGEGDEQSTRRIDDLERLLQEAPLSVSDRQLFFESTALPVDYMQWKRVSAKATKECCKDPKRLKIFQVEEGNIDDILRDKNKQPNFEWGETVATLKGNRLRIYTDEKFDIVEPILSYYRQPIRIQIAGVQDPYTGVISAVDVPCEFKDDLVELFIDEACKIIAGDIESINQINRTGQSVETNN